MDRRLALMAGIDIPIPECRITMHQPTIKEIAYLGESNFFIGVQTLCLNKTMFIEDKDVLETINNFQIFMTVMNDRSTADKKQNVQDVLLMTFPKYKVMITPRAIMFVNIDDNSSIIVDESNFEEFQEVMKDVFCVRNGPMDSQAFNPANAKAKEIAEKIMRGRQRVAEQKGSQNISIFSRYLSILTLGVNSMSLKDLLDCTMFQLYDLVERYMLYMNWDIDVRCRLAGGKPDNQPDDWMKEIH